MEKEILKLTRQEGQDIIWEENDDFEIIEKSIVDRGLWTIRYKCIVRRNDGKYFKTFYQVGATESQDEGPFEYTYPIFTEVIPVQKTITVYE